MKLGVMQPYFFPYLGYFELIDRTDRWVVFDVVQYNAKSWMNRNRILHPTQGWQYVTVPVAKAPHGTALSDIRIKDRSAAERRMLGQIEHYRRFAPYFPQVATLIEKAFSIDSDRLVDINVAGLAGASDYLGLAFQYTFASKIGLDLVGVEHAGQWALKIAQQLGATEYINPPGGREIFRTEEWDAAGIRLSFTAMPNFTYECQPYRFVEYLSILDVLMWNEPSVIVKAMRRQWGPRP
jgi:hypothetical protein